MSRVCELTGKRAMVGNNVSHALNRTKRKFKVNLVKKRFYLPEEDKWITLKVSTRALKNINKKGVEAVIAEARANGYLKK
ncbi:MAG: 50S ribosomal protein L28 [Flavobacteriaceae bacterium]|jgi:large subunit ribosomal protein L28|uniref:50S ribosomal protein L28 n=1 Tax=Lutimonas saemankumensis TaxID=483016 RepID=UPI001CD3F3D0|nr:50S ribosomal protein L28 [Lutimonas saemankumensis]MCA0933840.1 50S ribosomal protein L28 [Lutimonas saemankumensis]UCE94041.1 MAG: 50S ribosomal protein L28 [Flavobacteriaceae bacterium]